MALRRAEPGEIVDLRPLGDQIKTTKTSAIVRTPGFQAVRLVVPAGREIASHQVAGRITLHCIEGEVELGLPDGPRRMRAGDWTFLEGGVAHSLLGIEDASLLLTILFDD